MITGTLTLLQWSLRSDVRSLWPHLVRAGFAVFMLISVSAAFVEVLQATGPGLLFFERICFLNFLLILAAGISYFVSAVTEEKDSGTLSLLRLAGVSPIQIILGKSTSRLISSLMLLWIQLPFTFLAITLGGVTWRQIVAAYLLLGAWMAFVANLALLASVRCRTAGRAAALSCSALLLFLAIGPILQASLPALPPAFRNPTIVARLDELALWLDSVGILTGLSAILATADSDPPLIGNSFIWHTGAAAVLFVTSVLLFDFWLVPAETSSGSAPVTWRRFAVGRCWRLPLVWKDFLFFTGGRSFFAVKLFAYGGFVAAAIIWQWIDRFHFSYLLQNDFAWLVFVTLFIGLNVEAMLYASGSLFSEVRQSTLSSLAMLPYRTERILLEKLGAAALALVPVLLWIAVVALMDWPTVRNHLSATMIVSAAFVLLLNVHLTVLLSLYTRWGALPLALLITLSALTCCPILVLPVFGMAGMLARSHNLEIGLLLGAVLNMVWGWLFVLLPIELEIVNRWNRLSQRE